MLTFDKNAEKSEWRAKFIRALNKKPVRIQIRKKVHGADILVEVTPLGSVTLSMNGPAQIDTYLLNDLMVVIEEAKQALDREHRAVV